MVLLVGVMNHACAAVGGGAHRFLVIFVILLSVALEHLSFRILARLYPVPVVVCATVQQWWATRVSCHLCEVVVLELESVIDIPVRQIDRLCLCGLSLHIVHIRTSVIHLNAVNVLYFIKY